MIVRRIKESKGNRQVIVVTQSPDIVVEGDAEAVIATNFRSGQRVIVGEGTASLQERGSREEVWRMMLNGLEAFESRHKGLAAEVPGAR